MLTEHIRPEAGRHPASAYLIERATPDLSESFLLLLDFTCHIFHFGLGDLLQHVTSSFISYLPT